jgi:HlyD family secretion protein
MADTERSLANVKKFGFRLVALLGLAVFGWGAQARISGAIIAAGNVAVRSDTKSVQHLEGGIVAELFVRDGVRVAVGDELIRLDDTQTRASLEITTSKLNKLLFEQARLEAERERSLNLEIPVSLVARSAEPEIRRIFESQQKLLEKRLENVLGKHRQLQEQVSQLRSQIEGLQQQHSAKSKKADIISAELEKLQGLKKKGLVQGGRVTALERESADLDAEIAQLVAEAARLKAKISETELRIIEIEESWQEKILERLVEVRADVTSLQQQQIAEQARLTRILMRAPQAGTVHALNVHSIGAVIRPGEPVMIIVPDEEELVARVQVAPRDIDQLYVGQTARVRFTAFNSNTTPEFIGEVVAIGADLTTDQATQRSFYRVDISIASDQIDALGGEGLRPGMPAEALIETTSRTALSYLLKPLSSQINRAFRD